jgi:hypothetical protein
MCSSSRAEVPQVVAVGFGTEMSEKRFSEKRLMSERVRGGSRSHANNLAASFAK